MSAIGRAGTGAPDGVPPPARSPWPVASILVAAPLIQVAMFVASGVDFATFSRFAFLSGMVMEYACLALVLRALRNEGRRLADVGLSWSGWHREAVIGIAAGVTLFVVAGVGAYFVEQMLPSTVSRDPRPRWAALVYGLALVTAFAPIEEIIWRGYAITTLREALGSHGGAVLLAALAFASIHWWGGPATVVMAGVMGLAFSALFQWRRTLTANIVAHFVLDLPLLLFMLFPAT